MGEMSESKESWIIVALGVFLSLFIYLFYLFYLFILKPQIVKCDWCQKSTQHFALF